MEYQIKKISGFEGYYADTEGCVWSAYIPGNQGKISKKLRKLKPIKDKDDYLYINLYKNKKLYRRSIHRLILETFISSCPEGMQCRHLDGTKNNNILKNLKWDTPKNNCADKIKHGTNNHSEKTKIKMAKTHKGKRLSKETKEKITKNKKKENCTNARLNEFQVRIIRRLLGFGIMTHKEIAIIFNVSRENIGCIKLNKSWKHIK